MSCARSPLGGEEDSVQEFQFDGAYAGALTQRKEAAGSTKRQLKRRGLWKCFAQPRVDEPIASSPSHASPSRLTLTAQQLAFRSSGKQEEQCLPVSNITDVQFKWIHAGGVRVSKVTVTLDSGKEPVVIRGLKNPEHLVDAVRKRQQAALNRVDKLPDVVEARRSCEPPRTSPTGAGRWSEPAVLPAKRIMITPRALFADATGSPASAANSGCGSMTLMSAFARSPAQEFAGVESVAREIQLASPGQDGNDDDYYSSSSDSMVHEVDTLTTTAAAAAAGAAAAVAAAVGRLAARASPPRAETRSAGPRATPPSSPRPPPPCQPSDSFAIPPSTTPLSSIAAAVAALPAFTPRTAGGGPAGRLEELTAVGVALTQHLPRGPAPQLGPASGGSPLLGGSPPPRAEDSMPEGASVTASVAGSPHPAPSCVAGGSPPPVPEDSLIVYAAGIDGGSTPASPLSGYAPGDACRSGSPLARDGGAVDLSRGDSSPQPTQVETVGSAPLDSSGSPASTPRLLSSISQQRPHDGSHRLANSSVAAAPPPAPRAAGDRSPEEPGAPARPSGDSSFQSASSGELTDGPPSASLQESGAEPALATVSDAALVLGSGPDRKSTSPVAALGIAAVSATVSAMLTSAATAGLGAVGLAGSSAPFAVAAPGSTAVVATSVGAAPLTLLGLTAAAAMTLVAAAAITHIRTGSPLRPLESPYDFDPWEETAARAEPLLSAKARASARELPESPASWFGGRQSCGRSVSGTAPGSVGSISPAAAVLASPQMAADDDAISATAVIGGVSRACSAPMPDLAAEPSLRCAGGPSNEASAVGGLGTAPGCLSPVTGASGATTIGSGEGTAEDGATSGAWGSQPTLVDFDPDHPAAAGPVEHVATRPSQGGVGSGGCAAAAGTAGAAPGLGGEQPHLETEEEALPVMLFSEGPGGMPPLVRNGEHGVGAAEAVAAPGAHGDGVGKGDGERVVVHGGELRPPSQLQLPAQLHAAAEPEPAAPFAYATAATGHQDAQARRSSQQTVASRRDSTVRQLFPDDDSPTAPVPYVPPVPHGSSAQRRHHQQQDEGGELKVEAVVYGSNAPGAGAPAPLSAAASDASALQPQPAASPGTRRQRAQQLTESPVRVLYSVHAAFAGLRPGAQLQWAVPLLPTADLGVQTEAPEAAVAECAAQTEARGSMGAGSPSSTAGSGAAAGPAPPSLEESALQRVFALNSPQENSSSGNPGDGSQSSVSVAAGPNDGQEADGPSPPQAGAQDWYMSSVGVGAALAGGFELAAAAAVGHAREGPSESPSTVNSSPYRTSSSPLGSSLATISPLATRAASARAPNPLAFLYHAACCSSPRSQPTREASRLAYASSPRDGGGGVCSSIATNEETPLLGRQASLAANVNAAAPSAVQMLSPALQSLLGVMRPAVGREAPPPPTGGCSSSNSRTTSSGVTGSSSSAPRSASVGSGLYTPMRSDASSSVGASATGAAAAAAPSGLSYGPVTASSSGAQVATAASEHGTDPQRRLLAPGVPLSTEPLARWIAQAVSSSALAASGKASSPSASGAQDARRRGPLQGGDASSTIAAEPPSARSAVSDTADDMVWLLGPPVGVGRATDDGAVSAPASPRIPPPPPLAHSNTTSRGGSTRSCRLTAETEESLGGAAGCCSSRRSSSGSCGGQAAAAAADRASLAWLLARGSAIRAAAVGHGGAASPRGSSCLGPSSDGNQFAAAQSTGACASAAALNLGTGLHAPIGGGSEILSGSCISGTAPGSPVGAPQGPLATCEVDSLPGAGGVRGCSCSGDGGGSAGVVSSGSQSGSPAPQSPSGASIAASRAAAPSPDLSDISSAYAAGVYVYGSPYSSPGTDTPGGGPRVGGPGARAIGGGGGADGDAGVGDDLFQNPLYSTPGNDAGGPKSPRARPPRHSSGCIALPTMPYSDGGAYGSGNSSTTTASTATTTATTTSPEPVSAEPRVREQPTVGVELPVGAGRRRTREEATAASLYLYDDAGGVLAGQFGAEDETAASRQSTTEGDSEACVGTPVAVVAGATAGAAAGPGGSAGAEAQPLKRARMQVPQDDLASSDPAQQQQQLFCTPAPAPPGGTTVPAQARGLPLVSPLMVLNPTYAQSAGGSPGMTSSPPTAARSDDVSAARADATPRASGLAAVGGTPQWDAGGAAKPKTAGCKGGDEGAALAGALEVAGQPRSPLQMTPRNRELAQLQGSDWGSLQGSPSSQQAAHAAVLLRNANDAVDFAREAVQRGDAEWLTRVTATLHAVQSALDALREF